MDSKFSSYLNTFIQVASNKVGLDFKYFLDGGFWIFLRYFFVSVSGLAITVAFARYSQPDFFGRYQYVLSLLSLFSIGALPGLAFPLMREFSQKNDMAFITVSRYSLISGLIAASVLFMFAPYFVKHYNEIKYSIWLIIAIFPLVYALNYWYIFFEYYGKYKEVSIALSLQSALLALVIIGQIYFGSFSLSNFIAAYILILLVFNIVMSGIVFRKVSRMDIGTGEISLKYGIEITIQKGLFIIVDIALPFFIPLLLGFGALAYYQVGAFFAIAFGGLVSGLSSLYIPLLFKYKNLNYSRIIVQNIFLGAGIFVCYSFFIYFIFPVFYRENYALSQDIAWVFSISVCLFPLRIFLQNFFGTQRENGIIIKTYLLAIIISVVGFYLFSQESLVLSVLVQLCLFNGVILISFLKKYYSLTHGAR
jgi:O-antigen/teichoic acid export membrane protein